ncbi:histidine kinase [candidate division KSB1 bacterium]|nr:histidine kinase [candidate division KSB1 bacterium]
MTKTNLFGRWRATTASQIRKYHFELKHILLLFIVLLSAQILISFVQKISLERFLAQTQDSYQKDSSERLSNLTATALELLLGTSLSKEAHVEEEKQKIIEAFNIILSQQLLLQGVEDICLLTENGDSISVIDNGQVLYEFFLGDSDLKLGNTDDHPQAIDYYLKQKSDLRAKEMIHSFLSDEQTFHVLVPFVPKGEYAGALYVKNKPNFSLITDEIVSSYNESSLIFSGLIFVGFVAMFLISSSTLRERDIAQEQLFRERESQLKERINRQKEALFTKRIYHAHHKAEKVMGFIKEDLRIMHADNMSEIRNRITKYANFIARVIYDMKWYDPPLQTIRNPLFRTDLNEVVRFIVNEVCLRVTQDSQQFRFRLDLQDTVPLVPINEYVVWEILEPLFQNSLDHNPDGQTTIEVCSRYHADQRVSHITISDDGQGIDPALLVPNEDGIKRLFLENISTKNNENNTGYGCYLAYEISKHRCGWQLDAENLPEGGCRFTITIQHNG